MAWRMALAAGGWLTVAALAVPADKPVFRGSLSDLSLEVNALQTLYDLDLTPTQLKALAQLAKDTGQKSRSRKPAKASAKFVALLTDLRTALARADADRVDDLTDKLDKLRESESPALDDDVATTDAARKHAPDALRLLTARQVADHLETYEEIPDPLASVRDALKTGLKADAKKWAALREEAATEVGWLVAGFDADQAKKVRQQTASLLDKSHLWKEDELKDQQEELEKAVLEIMADVGPTDVLQHIVERDLAELLSNPRLGSAIAARLKEAK